jgi:hypothetical protein
MLYVPRHLPNKLELRGLYRRSYVGPRTCVCVYYCRTLQSCSLGGEESGGHVLLRTCGRSKKPFFIEVFEGVVFN